jgi:hypothetical protein
MESPSTIHTLTSGDTIIDMSSEICDSDVTMVSKVAVLPSAAPTLRKFPPEIRDMIYKLTLAGEWNAKTPTFIIALRGDSELYHEALKVFYETNTFAFTERNQWVCTIRTDGDMAADWDLGKTSVTPMKSIKHAIVDFPSIPYE